MLHTETQMSIPSQYQRSCTDFYTTVKDARTSLMQPLSNHQQERQKFFTLHYCDRRPDISDGTSLQSPTRTSEVLHFTTSSQGGHPPTCSTIHYGQVQKKQWTQLPDTQKD